jgi:methyl-accepting chemotaxis protein
MKYFTNLSTRAKLLFSFGLIWIMFLIIISIAYRDIQGVVLSGKEMHDVYFAIDNDLSDLRAYENFEEWAVLDMMLTQKQSERLFLEKSINEKTQLVNDIIEKLLKLDKDAHFQNQMKELRDNINMYRNGRKEVIALMNEGKIDQAKQLIVSVQGERVEKIRSIAEDLEGKASKNEDEQLLLSQQQADSSLLFFIIFGIAAFIFSVIIVVVMNRTIAQPLTLIANIASRIASGDLKVEVSANERKDEVGLLNQAFYIMVEKLRRSMKEIIEGINLLGSSASEILAATTQVASGSAETATAITETTTTVEEIRQAAQLSNKKATRVSENAQQVSQVTQNGQIAVDETVSGMHDIQNQMEAVANTIVRLSEQNQQIGEIIASVTDVADQANLLAVNAAIEAAKAGEQGKGFAVVAQEIKNLAQQSKQATIQVRNILIDVQKATSAAVMATEQTSKAVENGVKQSIQAGEAIKKLADSSSKALEAASQIVASSQQQVVGMDQIGLAMQNINQAGTENAASMIQAEKAAKGLNELGQKLKLLVEQYKL